MSGNHWSESAGRVGPPPLDRQLRHFIDQPPAAQAADTIRDLRLTNILSNLATASSSALNEAESSSSASQAELQRFFVRVQTSLQSSQNVAFGLRLANEALRVLPWYVIVPHAADWIQAAVTHFRAAVNESIVLLGHLLGPDAQLRAEYWRNVGGPATSKYATILLESAEKAVFSDVAQHQLPLPLNLSAILDALASQIDLRPSTFRSQAPRIHKLCVHLLFERQALIREATRLLAKLPMTGKGADGQATLWSATSRMLLDDAKAAWATCCSTFQSYEVPHQRANAASNGDHAGANLQQAQEPTDDLDALRLAHRRIELLLGSMPSPGIIGMFLSEATSDAVSFPLSELYDLTSSILSLSPSSSSRLGHGTVPEATLYAAQAALLPRAHLCAITLLATLPRPSWAPGGHGRTIRSLLTVAEKGSPSIRCAALNTLARLRLPLDPHGPLLVRAARTCLAQLSRLVNQSSDETGEHSTSTKSAASGRAKKKRRMFESDQIVFRPIRGFVELDVDEYEACRAAAVHLGYLYGYLTTFITHEHHDLAQTTALLILGLLEIALRQPDGLTSSLVRTLARLVSLSRGSLLGLLSVRAATLCAQALTSEDEQVRSAAEVLELALADTFHPKLPPKLALRLHVEADRLDAIGQTDGEAERVLDEPVLDEERGASEMEALREVMNVDDPGAGAPSMSKPVVSSRAAAVGSTADAHSTTPGNPASVLGATSSSIFPSTASSNLATANATSVSAALSPDPIKPIRRPSTPRIGSPGAGAAKSVRPSLSPEHSTASVATVPAQRLSAHERPLTGRTSSSSSGAGGFASAATTHGQERALPSSPLSKQLPERRSQVKTAEKHGNDGASDDEDSDGSLPALDLRSSDEESDDDQQ